jgi:hypothetical protein
MTPIDQDSHLIQQNEPESPKPNHNLTTTPTYHQTSQTQPPTHPPKWSSSQQQKKSPARPPIYAKSYFSPNPIHHQHPTTNSSPHIVPRLPPHPPMDPRLHPRYRTTNPRQINNRSRRQTQRQTRRDDVLARSTRTSCHPIPSPSHPIVSHRLSVGAS